MSLPNNSIAIRTSKDFILPVHPPSAVLTVGSLFVNMHGISRLPIELLCEIFQYCVVGSEPENDEDIDDFSDLPTVSALQAPVSLTRVCSHWRNVALGCRRIWTGIRLHKRGIEGLELDPLRDALSLSIFAHRSGSLPMSVSLHYLAGDLPEHNPEGLSPTEQAEIVIDVLFEALLKISHRIQSLEVTLSRELMLPAVFMLSTIEFLQLEILRFEGDSTMGLPYIVDPENMPKIRDVTLVGGRLLEFPTGDNEEEDQDGADFDEDGDVHVLDRLCLEGSICTHAFLSNLRFESMFSVTELFIRFPSSFNEEMDPASYVALRLIGSRGYILPHVTSLTLEDSSPFGYNNAVFFNHARLPNLQYLTIIMLGSFDASKCATAPGLAYMLEMSRPPLVVLEITGTSMNGKEFQDCLGFVSGTLEELRADGDLFTVDTIKALTLVPISLTMHEDNIIIQTETEAVFAQDVTPITPHTNLCPRLIEIEIDACAPCPADQIKDMILSRSSQQTRLEQLTISCHCENFRRISQFPEIKELMDKKLLIIRVEES